MVAWVAILVLGGAVGLALLELLDWHENDPVD